MGKNIPPLSDEAEEKAENKAVKGVVWD